MKRYEYTMHTGKRIELPNGNFRWEPTGIITRTYDWEVKDDKVIVNGKWMKTEYDCELTYGLRKTKIKSYGLKEVLEKFTTDKFWSEDADKILSWVEEHGKEVKK